MNESILALNLNEQPIYELKRIALDELKLTPEQVKTHGNLTYKATWIAAIREVSASLNFKSPTLRDSGHRGAAPWR
ncbi:MAG: hypothetical protein HC920_08390 [Oscillatoriales cyanobacterium SM2_3_0]|nr:hypothetical protein [Oscillatoriales cyanobacterium SM2_3_0]